MPIPGPSLYPSPGLYPGSAGGSAFTAGLLASLAPWNDPAGNWQAYNTALAAPFEQIYSIVADEGSPDEPVGYTAGWSVLLDPDNCPTEFLPFCGLFVGVVIPPGTDDVTARAIIKAEAGFSRGTPGSIIAAAKRNLIGTQSVSLLERTPDPYSFVLVVRPEECPNATALTNAVNAVKPVGLVWSLVQTDGWTLFQMEAAYGSIAALEAAFTTITGLENDQVGH